MDFDLILSLGWLWLRISGGFGFWLSFTRICAGFALICFDFGWISVGFGLILNFRLLLLGFLTILCLSWALIAL